MNQQLRLQRLIYPDRGPQINRAEFGPSDTKFKSMQKFFACAAMPNFEKDAGTAWVQPAIDRFYEGRKESIARSVSVSFDFFKSSRQAELEHPDKSLIYTRPFHVLGRDSDVEQLVQALGSVTEAYRNDGPLLVSGLQEFMGLEFLNKSRDKVHYDDLTLAMKLPAAKIRKDTMGWLDIDRGCFIMRSETALKNVQELFGIRPYVPIRTQAKNYE